MDQSIQLGRKLTRERRSSFSTDLDTSLEIEKKQKQFSNQILGEPIKDEPERVEAEKHPSENKSIQKNYILLPLFFAISFFGALFLLNSNFNGGSSANSNVAGEQTENSSGVITGGKPQVTNEHQEGTRTFPLNPNNRVAYVTGGNVWVMNLDGTNKSQVTVDGSEFGSYRNLTWKNSNELSYSSCYGGECSILHFNLSNDIQYSLLSMQSPMINTMSWSPDGVHLYINYVKPDGSYESMRWEEGNKLTVLRQYTPPSGENFTHDDQIEYSFSYNGEYVAATNTFVSTSEIENVVIYDRKGKQISVISGETNLPDFTADSSVFFKTGDKYYKGKIGSIQSSVIIDGFEGIDADLSVDGTHLVYWQLRDGTHPYTLYRNLDTGDLREIGTNFRVETWINESNILGYSVENVSGVHQYDIQKLASTDLNGNLNILVDSNVSEFEVNEY